MDAKTDTLWARYSQNDQTDSFNFLKLIFFYRANDAYSFWAQSGISKGMFFHGFCFTRVKNLLNVSRAISFIAFT